jgi:flagellar basal body L-ring protein FlgH
MSLLHSCAAVTLGVLCLTSSAGAQNTSTREVTVRATVDRIQKPERVVTFRAEGNLFQNVYFDPTVKGFDDLKVGDVVTVRYQQSVVVKVNRNAKLSTARDTTAEAQKTDPTVMQQLTAVVTVDSVDIANHQITYRTADDRKMAQAVDDTSLLKGLHSGDRIEVTLTRAKAISIGK